MTHKPKKFDDYHMGSVTNRRDTSSLDEETERKDEIEMQINRRGIRKYLNAIRKRRGENTPRCGPLDRKAENKFKQKKYMSDRKINYERAHLTHKTLKLTTQT